MAGPAIQDLKSELETLLKTHYADGIREQQNNTPMAYKLFKRSTIHFGGNFYEGVARMGQPQSIGMRPLRTALPTPRGTIDVPFRVRHKYFYATGDITGPDIKKGQSNVDAFVNIQTDKMDAIVTGALKDLNFQFFLAGDGAYARIVHLPATVSKVGVDTIKYLRVDRRIDLWDDSGSAIGEAAGVNNRAIMALTVESGMPTVQFKNDSSGAALARDGSQTGSFAAAVGDLLIPETAIATGANTAGIFFHGLKAIVDDGSVLSTFQEINRTTYPQWQAKVLSNSGSARPLTLQLMQYADNIPEIRSGEKVNLILGSYNTRDLYQNLLVSQKRFHTNKLDGGYEVLDFNGKTFVVEVDCQDDRIYFLHKEDIEHFGLMDLEFDDSDGAILKHAGLPSGDVYYFFLKAYGNFGTHRCNSHAVITDLEVDQNYLLAA